MRALRLLGAIGGCALSCSGTGAANRGTADPGNSGGDNGLITPGAGGDSTTTGGSTGNTGGVSINPSDPSDGADGGCNDLHVKYEKLFPTVLLLVDESGSMFENKYPANGTESRWTVLRKAIVDPASFVTTLKDKVRLGVATFTSDNNNLATCPIMAKTTIAFNNDVVVKAALPDVMNKPFSYKGDTPTAAAIKAAAKVLADVKDPGPKFILLATDGDPDDCKQADPNCGQDESVAETQAAYAQKIGTFVIGISDDVHAVFLQDIANAGAGLPVVRHTGPNCDPNQPPPYLGTYATAAGMNAAYYAPTDQAAISTALNTIISGVRSCVLEMHGKIDLTQAAKGKVYLDGKKLELNDPNGWKANDETHVEYIGEACKTINTEANPVIDISFPCDVYTPIN